MTLDTILAELMADQRVRDLSKFCFLLAGFGLVVLVGEWLLEALIVASLRDSGQCAADEQEMHNDQPPVAVVDAAAIFARYGLQPQLPARPMINHKEEA